MGISYRPNIGVDGLSRKIADAESAKVEEKEIFLSKGQQEQKLRDEVQKEGLALIRCRIANLNPSKTDINGEFIVVANRYLGTVRKYVPFHGAAAESYHLPKVLVDDLKGRMYQSVITKKKDGKIMHKVRRTPEYNIQILPPLTEKEMEDLKIQQSANHSFDEDEF